MRNFLQLARPDMGNQNLNLAPVQNALEQWGQTTQRNALMEQRQQENAYQRGRDQRQDARQDETFRIQNLERLGKSAFAFSQLAEDQRDPATWVRLVKGMQAYEPSIGTEPDDLDPIRGPAKFAAVYGGMVRDPREDRLMDLKIAGAERDLTKPMGGDDPNAVREYRYYMSLPDDQKAEYLRVKRAERTVDLGPRVIIPDVANPAAPPVATFEKDLAGAEREKVVGRETGERVMGAPKARAALAAVDAKSDIIEKTIADARKLVGPFTTGAGSLLSAIPGTAARDLSAKIDTLKANAGFAELQAMRDNSPTGGALGQVAVQELAMLQATITSLEQAQTAEQLSEALNAYEQFIRESKVRRKLAYDLTYGAADEAPAPPAGDDWTEIDGVRIREKR